MFEPKYCVDNSDSKSNSNPKASAPVTSSPAASSSNKHVGVAKAGVTQTGGQVTNPERAAIDPSQENELKAKVKKQEKLVRDQLSKQMSKVHSEAKKLGQVQKALESLEAEHQRDIDVLRVRIEDSGRKLHYAEQQFKRAEAEYLKARETRDKFSKEKDELTEHLQLIIM